MRRCRWPTPTCTTCPAATSRASRPRSAGARVRSTPRGLAITTYFNPMVCTRYPRAFNEAAASRRSGQGRGSAGRSPTGTRAGWARTASSSSASSTSPPRRACELLRRAPRRGGRGWPRRLDGGFRRVHAVRRPLGRTACPAPAMHNLYPVLYHRRRLRVRPPPDEAGWRGTSGLGGRGVQRYAQLVWGGDPTVDWGFDGLSLRRHPGAHDGPLRGSPAGDLTSAGSSR